MRKFNIIITMLKSSQPPRYHVAIHPWDYSGGAVPYHEYLNFEGFVQGLLPLGFAESEISAINAELIRTGKAIVLHHNVSEDGAEAFGWPKELSSALARIAS